MDILVIKGKMMHDIKIKYSIVMVLTFLISTTLMPLAIAASSDNMINNSSMPIFSEWARPMNLSQYSGHKEQIKPKPLSQNELENISPSIILLNGSERERLSNIHQETHFKRIDFVPGGKFSVIMPINENDNDSPVQENARFAIENIQSIDDNNIIATYGKEREFYIEDERKEWLAKLDIIGRSARNDIEKLVQPNGPVITYGLNYQGYIVVEFLKDSEIDPYQLEIYNIIDAEARRNGIADIPVIFKYGGVIPTQDVTGEGDEDETVSVPGFTVHLFVPALYACLWLTKRAKYTKDSS